MVPCVVCGTTSIHSIPTRCIRSTILCFRKGKLKIFLLQPTTAPPDNLLISSHIVFATNIQLSSYHTTKWWRKCKWCCCGEWWSFTSWLCHMHVACRYLGHWTPWITCIGTRSVHVDTMSTLVPHWMFREGKCNKFEKSLLFYSSCFSS